MAYGNMITNTAAVPGTYGYQAPDITGSAQQATGLLNAIPTKHQSKKKWYRKYRSWSDFYRQIAQGGLGQGTFDQPLDPLAQLQQQLQGEYDPNAMQNAFSQNFDFDRLLGAHQRGLRQSLQQQAAQMGVEGAFGGVLDTATRARQTLSDQAMAAYRPQAWQMQQQASDQTQQLLNAILQAEVEAEFQTESAGRQA